MKPVINQWSYVGECIVKLLGNMNSCIKFATKIKDTYEAGNIECDIDSDFLSLVREYVLLPMTSFLLGFHNSF